MANFRGGWLARQGFYTDPAQAALHTVDPRHMASEGDPNPTWEAPGGLQVTDDIVVELDPNYVGLDYVTDTTGVWYDHTPHDPAVGYAGSADPDETDAQNRAEAGAAHATDYGASTQGNYGGQYAPLTFSDERYLTPRFESLPPPEINPVVPQRGFNGQAANVPDPSVNRLGWVEQSWVDRKMMAPAGRTHDQRVVSLNTATVATDTPPTANPYGSPFRALARILTRTWQSPMIRRDPPPMDEQLVQDGSDDLYATEDSYVVM